MKISSGEYHLLHRSINHLLLCPYHLFGFLWVHSAALISLIQFAMLSSPLFPWWHQTSHTPRVTHVGKFPDASEKNQLSVKMLKKLTVTKIKQQLFKKEKQKIGRDTYAYYVS